MFEYIGSLIKDRVCGDAELSVREGEGFEVRLSGCGGVFTPSPFLMNGKVSLDELKNFSLVMAELSPELSEIVREGTMPVLCKKGESAPDVLKITPGEGRCSVNFDLLGTIFYILTRAEEIANPVTDEHGRFPAYASSAFQNNYLHRPVVDELFEVLRHILRALCPGVQFNKRDFSMKLTHDVDAPYESKSLSVFLRSVGGDVLKRRSLGLAARRASSFIGKSMGYFGNDLFNTFERLMDLDESAGCRAAYYFIPDNSGSDFNGNYDAGSEHTLSLMRRISERGHEIGYHGSYGTFKDRERTCREVELLRNCGVSRDIRGGRQHYLRWSAPETWRNYAAAGLSYDTTLSFADAAGFRCGTSLPFKVFDIEQRREIPLIEFPLIVMEASLFSQKYMGYSHEKAFEYMSLLKDQCRRHNGVFTLLWHNSCFTEERDWELYKAILRR